MTCPKLTASRLSHARTIQFTDSYYVCRRHRPTLQAPIFLKEEKKVQSLEMDLRTVTERSLQKRELCELVGSSGGML